jgi:hypothetical protein
LEEEGCHPVETEQERLDSDCIYGEIKRELIKRGIPAREIAFIGVRLSQSDAERVRALGSEAKLNGDALSAQIRNSSRHARRRLRIRALFTTAPLNKGSRIQRQWQDDQLFEQSRQMTKARNEWPVCPAGL